MEKLYLFICFFIITIAPLSAQQLPHLDNNQSAQSVINPALISGNYWKYAQNASVDVIYRHQWAGLEEAPRTLSAGFEYFGEDYNFLTGANIIHDQTGPSSMTGIYGRAGYRIEISNDISISAAISGGIVQYRMQSAGLSFLENGDGAQANETKLLPDFGLGAVLNTEYFYIGLSVPQTFGLNLEYRKENNDFDIQKVRHYYAVAGTYLPLYNDGWLEIHTWGKYVPNVPFHIGGSLKYEYNESFWIGLNGSSAGAIGGEAGLIFTSGDGNNLCRFGYAFSQYLTTYGPQFGSTHELRFAYAFEN